MILATLLVFLPLSGFSNESANTPSRLDILWVVDNSSSMTPYQQKLSASLDGFLEHLVLESKNDSMINMALISTDLTNLEAGYEIVYDITKSKASHAVTQSQAVSDFKNAINNLGNRGNHSYEQAFMPVMMVFSKLLISRAYDDRRFLRKDSKLAIIIISDEDEQGIVLTPEQFVDALSRNKEPDTVGVYGLLGMTEKGEDCGTQYAGSRYEAVINATNGRAFPICGSFSYSFSQIADQLITRFNL